MGGSHMARHGSRLPVLAWIVAFSVIWFGFVGPAAAQARAVTGTLWQVDSKAGSFMVDTQTFSFTQVSIAYAGDARITQLAALQQFVGSAVTVQYALVGTTQVAGRVAVLVAPAQGNGGIYKQWRFREKPERKL